MTEFNIERQFTTDIQPEIYTTPTLPIPSESAAILVSGHHYVISTACTWQPTISMRGWTRVIGIDSFLSEGYLKTSTYVRGFNGLVSLLNHPLLASIIKNVELNQLNDVTGEFDINRKYIIIALHDTPLTEEFKKRFFGTEGKNIRSLSQALNCKITIE